jgi:hypothetical protein
MPRAQSTPLSAPVFDEPTVTPDPVKFKALHPSDTQLYKQIQQLLAKDVVGFDKMSGAPNSLFSLADALGPNGAKTIQEIQAAKRIVFHAGGDSGRVPHPFAEAGSWFSASAKGWDSTYYPQPLPAHETSGRARLQSCHKRTK